jgi:hypothetical protein
VWSNEWRNDEAATLAMSHTGVVVTHAGLVVSGGTSEPALVARDRTGRTAGIYPVDGVTELHDLTLVENGEELIWIADIGVKFYGGGRELEHRQGTTGGQVLQVDLEGRTRRRLDAPPLKGYSRGAFVPTAVAVDEARLGGGGDIWVADGYGLSLVHRYAADGRYLQTLSGEEGAGRFDEPHDIVVDRRWTPPELYVADRRNHRLQVFDLEGRFLRVVEHELSGPTQMAVHGDLLAVTEILAGRVSILDTDDRVVARLFGAAAPPTTWDDQPDGWPNTRSDDGVVVAFELEPQTFHAPHGIGAASDGTLYVTEFAIGGRLTVLTPAEVLDSDENV